jgi:hypothetical protein
MKERLFLRMESLSQKNSSGKSDPILDHILDQKEKNFLFLEPLDVVFGSEPFFSARIFRNHPDLEPAFIYFSINFCTVQPWFLCWISGPSPTTITALALTIWTFC